MNSRVSTPTFYECFKLACLAEAMFGDASVHFKYTLATSRYID